MSKTSYTIKHADSTKPAITLTSAAFDTTSLPITLVGPSYKPVTTDDRSWGEVLQESLLHMTENYCAGSEPDAPLDGMLWYDSSVKTLKLRYTKTNGDKDWFAVGVAGSLPPGVSPVTVANNQATVALPLFATANSDTTLTGSHIVATREWVQTIIQDPTAATPITYGSAAKDESAQGKNNVHYYELPGNFLMVWGNAIGKFRPTQVRGKTPLGIAGNTGPVNYFADATVGDASTTLATAESTIIGATITFADYGIPEFKDTSYSVVLSEVIPKFSSITPGSTASIENKYDETTGFLRRTCPQNWAGYNKVSVATTNTNLMGGVLTGPTSTTDNRMKSYEAIPPMVFTVYAKTTTGFKIHATTSNPSSDKVLYSSWTRFFADCNFQVIGHKKTV